MPNNKERILAVSRQLFLHHGYNGISIRKIASKARLTTGAIYFHFKNKRDIYETICLEALDMLTGKFRAVMGKKERIPHKLISTFDSYLSFYYNNRDYYNILMEYKAEYGAEGEGGKEDITRKMKELLAIVMETIQRGIDGGDFRETNPLLLAMFLAAVGEGMLQYKKIGLLSSMKIEDREFRKFIADVIGRGIEKGR